MPRQRRGGARDPTAGLPVVSQGAACARIASANPGSGAPGPEPAAMPGNTRIAATTNSLMRLAP